MTHQAAERVIGLYSDNAEAWISDRPPVLGRGGEGGLDEAGCLERFMVLLPSGGSVLDVGCGSGWPVGAALIERGFRVTGVDPAPGLLDHAARTLPAGEWIAGDMRTLELGRTFDGVLAWWSLFHLSPADQRIALPRILGHAASTAAVMFQTGPAKGERIGQWRGEPLYHASLDPQEYRAILKAHGFVEVGHDGGRQSQCFIWLAQRGIRPAG